MEFSMQFVVDWVRILQRNPRTRCEALSHRIDSLIPVAAKAKWALYDATSLQRRNIFLFIAGQTLGRLVYQDSSLKTSPFDWKPTIVQLRASNVGGRLGESYLYERFTSSPIVAIYSFWAKDEKLGEVFMIAEEGLIRALGRFFSERESRLTGVHGSNPKKVFGVLIVSIHIVAYQLVKNKDGKILQRLSLSGKFEDLSGARPRVPVHDDHGLAMALCLVMRAWEEAEFDLAAFVLGIWRYFYDNRIPCEQREPMTMETVLSNLPPLTDSEIQNIEEFILEKPPLNERLRAFHAAEKYHPKERKEHYIQSLATTLMMDRTTLPPEEPVHVLVTPQWNEQLTTLRAFRGFIRRQAADLALTIGPTDGGQMPNGGENCVEQVLELKDERETDDTSVRKSQSQLFDRAFWLERFQFPCTVEGDKLPITLSSTRGLKTRLFNAVFLEDHGTIEDAICEATGLRPGIWDIQSYEKGEDAYSLDKSLWERDIVYDRELLKIHARYLKAQGVSEENLVPKNSAVRPEVAAQLSKPIEDLSESFAKIGCEHPTSAGTFISTPKSVKSEEILKDQARMVLFREAVNENIMKDKIVLDVGCGTGILSMSAARAGAQKVYAVDCSNIVNYAQKTIVENGFHNTVTVMQTKIEDLVLPDGVEKVDVIVSEWMGSCLLHEGMIDKVIHARDKWLKPGGIMMPDKASLYICAIEGTAWNDGHDFDMSHVRNLALSDPLIDSVRADQVVTNHSMILELDMSTVTVAGKTFSAKFTLEAKRSAEVHALVVWFAVDFTKGPNPISLSTSPEKDNTPWKQTVFSLENKITVDHGDVLDGTLVCTPGEGNSRDLDFEVFVNYRGKNDRGKRRSFRLTHQKYQMR